MLIIGGLIFASPHANAGFFSDLFRFFTGALVEERVLEERVSAASISLPLLGSRSEVNDGVGGIVQDFEMPLSATQGNALVAARNPLGAIEDASKDQIVVYTVQKGDTPSGIAENFGISLNTLLWANNIRNANNIAIGDELVILPVTGISHTVKKGDTLSAIASIYKGDLTEIVNFNGLGIDETLQVDSVIIIPDGEIDAPKPRLEAPRVRYSSLPSAEGYFRRPIFGGKRSRGLHGYNAVDLAQTCGRPALASAEGAVILARSSGWNSGYGNYLVLKHANGTQTLYAHVQSILARVGQTVAQGSQIATVGTTGNSTGCHLHFEVRGAQNPF